MGNAVTAAPLPFADPEPTMRRPPVVAEAIDNLTVRVASAYRRRERMQRLDAARVHRLLGYVEALERDLVHERTTRAEFEAGAEGEFAELRLQLVAWKRYANTLLDRLVALGDQVGDLVRVTEPGPTRWWHWPARRRRDEAIRAAGDVTMADAYEPLPTAPESAA